MANAAAPIGKPTTYLLIDKYCDILEALEADEAGIYKLTDEQKSSLVQKRLNLETEMVNKIENIRDLKYAITLTTEKLKTEKRLLQDEIERINRNINRIEKVNDKVEALAIQMIERIGKPNANGVITYKTDLATYSVEQRWGHLNITDPEKVPDKYIKIETSYNLANMRKDVIEQGGATEFASVEKKKGLRIR